MGRCLDALVSWFRSLRRLGTDTPPARDRWRIEYARIRSRDSYFESDSQYEFRVIDRNSGKTVLSFWRDEFANASGSEDSGARQVTVDEDGLSVTVRYEDGREERYDLPG